MASRKKPNLSAALAQKNVDEQTNVPLQPPPPLTKKTAPSSKQASREGMKNISAWFPVNVKFSLEELKLKRSRELGRTVTIAELQAEAYNELFKKYGMPEIAPTTD